jgi:hypothetical protein
VAIAGGIIAGGGTAATGGGVPVSGIVAGVTALGTYIFCRAGWI